MEMANPPLHQSKDGQAMSDRVKKRPRQSGFESQSDKNELSYVEFYSGIGGWTMALEEAIKRLSKEDVLVNHHRTRRIAALDHSDLCTRVFKHNFGTDKKSFQIERLTKKQVEKWQARMWFMSPPCQPHTRQHTNQQKDLSDVRSSSFLHLCDLLSEMKEATLPIMICCENVVGFEKSNSFEKWQTVLADRKYHVGHFHLTPTQVDIPNDRPRYYCVAVQRSFLTDSDEAASLLGYLRYEEPENTNPARISTSIPELGVNSEPSDNVKALEALPTISSFLDQKLDESFRVPEKLLKTNAAWCFDIVSPNDRRSSCFTQSYGRYIRGTGSILYDDIISDGKKLSKPEEREFQDDWAKGFDLTKMRYFSGLELSRLFGFRHDFSFPSNCSAKQQWKLMGNSLNVRVASRIVELGLRSIRSTEN